MRTHLILALTLVLATPAVAQKVKVKYDKDHDFGRVLTYAWEESDHPDPDPLVHEKIVDSLDKWLAEVRILKEGPRDQPDLLLTYHSNARGPLELDLTRVRADEGGLLINPGGLFDRGTLVLDGRKPGDGKLVFHGVARGIHADTPEEEAKKIDKAARKLAEKLRDTIAFFDADLSPLSGRPVTASTSSGTRRPRST